MTSLIDECIKLQITNNSFKNPRSPDRNKRCRPKKKRVHKSKKTPPTNNNFPNTSKHTLPHQRNFQLTNPLKNQFLSSQQRTKLKQETQLPSTIRKRGKIRNQFMERKRKKTRTGKRNTRKRSRKILQRWSRKELNKNNIFLDGEENRPKELAH